MDLIKSIMSSPTPKATPSALHDEEIKPEHTLLDLYYLSRCSREQKNYEDGLVYLNQALERCSPVHQSLIYEGLCMEEMVICWHQDNYQRAKTACEYIINHSKNSIYYKLALKNKSEYYSKK